MSTNKSKWVRRPWVTVLLLAVLVWSTLAVYYLAAPSSGINLLAASALGLAGLWAIFSGRVLFRWLLAIMMLCVVAWWAWQRPSNDRPWRPEVAVTPRAIIDGDRIRLIGMRDFDYVTANDFSARYIEREVRLSELESVDYFISYWTSPPGAVAHTFVSFNFAAGDPISISIETRPEVGESFDPVGSMFKKFELIYIVGTERDLIGVRGNHRGESIYGYRIRASPDASRRLFQIYLERINELAQTPEFYHLLSNNCTLNIFRYANRAGREGGFEIRHLLNGWSDRYLYRAGLLETSMPFTDLRRRAHLNDAVRHADDSDDFSTLIRAGMTPTRRGSPPQPTAVVD